MASHPSTASHDPAAADRGAAGAVPAGRPLVVTADPGLREELVRLAAAAGVTPEVVADPGAALLRWRRAPLVVVGSDLAAPLAELEPARREGVQVVAWAPCPDLLFRAALGLGAEHVAELPRSEAWLVELLTDTGDQMPGRGLTVGVLGGSGGVGATTTACALALVAARSGSSALVDLDPLGPGVDRVLGLEAREGIRWDGLQQATGRLSARALADALPRVGGVGVLTWGAGPPAPVQPFAVREALSAATRGHAVVVVDVPRGRGETVDEVLSRCDRVLVVCAPSLAGVASAARTCASLPAALPVGLLVRGRGDPRAVGRVVRRPVLACVPDQRGLEEAVDLGLGPLRSWRGPLARAASEVLAALTAGAGEAAEVDGATAGAA